MHATIRRQESDLRLLGEPIVGLDTLLSRGDQYDNETCDSRAAFLSTTTDLKFNGAKTTSLSHSSFRLTVFLSLFLVFALVILSLFNSLL